MNVIKYRRQSKAQLYGWEDKERVYFYACLPYIVVFGRI